MHYHRKYLHCQLVPHKYLSKARHPINIHTPSPPLTGTQTSKSHKIMYVHHGDNPKITLFALPEAVPVLKHHKCQLLLVAWWRHSRITLSMKVLACLLSWKIQNLRCTSEISRFSFKHFCLYSFIAFFKNSSFWKIYWHKNSKSGFKKEHTLSIILLSIKYCIQKKSSGCLVASH